jgi:hypothetical protein
MSFSNYKSITFRAASGSSLIDGGESGRYATKLTPYTNTKGEKDFKFELYRCPILGNCSESNATNIGERNARGEWVPNNNENDTERKYYDKVNKQTKSQANSIRPSGLTASETATFNLRAGNGSQAQINETTADGEIINADGEIINGETGITTAYVPNINQGFGILSDVSVQGRKARTSYGNYYYPEDLASNKQDRIKFTMGYSEGTEVEASLVNQKSFQKKLKSISGSVTLPIVTGISDQSSVDWKGAELNPLQSFAAAGALDLFNQARDGSSLAQLGTTAGDIINTAKEGVVDSGVGDAINVWLAQKAVGAQNLLSRTTGAIVNPNLEMLFNAPQLRNFGFTFLLSPRDADEATQVRNIIRFFKQGMSVKTTNSNVFLKAPNIFAIKYMTYNTDGEEILHPSINIIKTCALLSMDLQYTPNGTYMTYEDPFRTMQAYQLTMQFGELDPIYDSDYTDLDNDNNTVIGY